MYITKKAEKVQPCTSGLGPLAAMKVPPGLERGRRAQLHATWQVERERRKEHRGEQGD